MFDDIRSDLRTRVDSFSKIIRSDLFFRGFYDLCVAKCYSAHIPPFLFLKLYFSETNKLQIVSQNRSDIDDRSLGEREVKD